MLNAELIRILSLIAVSAFVVFISLIGTAFGLTNYANIGNAAPRISGMHSAYPYIGAGYILGDACSLTSSSGWVTGVSQGT